MSSRLATVCVATTSVWVTSQRTESSATRTGMWVKVTSGSTLRRAHSTRSLRMIPIRVSGSAERRTSPGSNARTASSSASIESESMTSPTESRPNSANTDIVTSTRLSAAS